MYMVKVVLSGKNIFIGVTEIMILHICYVEEKLTAI